MFVWYCMQLYIIQNYKSPLGMTMEGLGQKGISKPKPSNYFECLHSLNPIKF